MTNQVSSEEDADRRLQFTIWCRVCGHDHHMLSHVKRHFKFHMDHRPYGTHCGCCDDILDWQEQVWLVNQYQAHLRLPMLVVAATPVTTLRNESCYRYHRRSCFSGRCRAYLERSAATRHVCTLAACFSQSSEDATLQMLLSVTPSSVFCRACEVTCHNQTR